MLVARALAVIDERDFVTPEDVKRVAVPVLAHRLSLTTQAWADGTQARPTWSTAIVADVPGPPTVGRRTAATPLSERARLHRAPGKTVVAATSRLSAGRRSDGTHRGRRSSRS